MVNGRSSCAAVRHVKTIRFARVLLGFVILAGLSAMDISAQSVGAFASTAGRMIATREGATSTLLTDGRVLIAGGFHPSLSGGFCDTVARAEIFDPSTGTFTATGNLIQGRFYPVATLLSDGRVLITGGTTCSDPFGEHNALSSAELYDPATGTFTATGDMVSLHRVGLTYTLKSRASLLRNGNVLITGFPSAEIYDPAQGVFTPAGPVVNNSTDAVVLPDDRVLIPGDSISVYEISGLSLQPAASFPESGVLGYQTATLLMNGQVLISGGRCSSPLPSCKTTDEAYLYDPLRGTVQSTGILAIPRVEHKATVLPGGRVLIVGGWGNDYDGAMACIADAEEYDPSTGGFSYAGTEPLINGEGNCNPTATLLPDGRVLITGGDSGGLAGAWLYIPPLRAASAASLAGPLAPESVASLFGSRLASTTVSADPLSPPTSLGGIGLRVRDSSGRANLARLFFVSPSEIRFEVPPGTALGDVTLELVNPPTGHDPVAVQVQNVAPGIFPFENNMVVGPSLAHGTIVLDGPVDLVVYATGIRNRSTLGNVQATIGGTTVPVESAGPDNSGVPGLDQVKIHVPPDFQGRGFQDLVLTVDGIPSNTTSVQIVGGRGATPAATPRKPSSRR